VRRDILTTASEVIVCGKRANGLDSLRKKVLKFTSQWACLSVSIFLATSTKCRSSFDEGVSLLHLSPTPEDDDLPAVIPRGQPEAGRVCATW
jgi:hypothetical protein